MPPALWAPERLAVINGHVYAVRESLPASNSATPPLKIVDVLPYKVLLEGEGKALELTYSNAAFSPGASQDADAHAGPDGVTVGSGTKKPRPFTGARSKGNSRTSGDGK